jgi:RNA polymerase sigma factor (sigma-70 family)
MPTVPDLDAWSGDLVRRFLAGERDSIDALVAQFRPVVIRAARRHLRGDHDVEDVLQETWMAFVAHASDIREPERVVGWLRATATNVARRIALRNARMDVIDHTTLDWPIPSFEEELTIVATRQTQRTAVEEATQQLPAESRRLVDLLADEQELSYAAIGTLTQRPVGSIGPSRARLLDKIRRHPLVRDLIRAETADAGRHAALAS